MNLKLNKAAIAKTKKGRFHAFLGITNGTQSKRHDKKKGAILWIKEQSKNDDIKIKYIDC